MDNILYYVCENTEQPLLDSDEIVEFEMPLYEDIPFNTVSESLDLYSVEDLMSSFSFCAERTYFSIEAKAIQDSLVRVIHTEAYVNNGEAFIEYTFEDGSKYVPARDFSTNDEEYSEEELDLIVEMAKEASSHLFNVNCKVRGSLLSFEKEMWG